MARHLAAAQRKTMDCSLGWIESMSTSSLRRAAASLRESLFVILPRSVPSLATLAAEGVNTAHSTMLSDGCTGQSA
jgi:hypothetical protein